MKPLMVLIMLLTCCSAAAQEEEAFADVFAGAGVSSNGVSAAGGVDMCMLGLVTGMRGSMHGFAGSDSLVSEAALLVGYKLTEESFNVSVSAGYSFAGYKCTENKEVCAGNRGGTYSGVTGQLQLVKMLGSRTGVGVWAFAVFNKRSDIYSGMLMFSYRL